MNENVKKILVCCDGSKYSDKAISRACELAKNYQAKTSLIHVVDKSLEFFGIFDRREYLKIMRKYGQKVLKKSTALAARKGIKANAVQQEGKVADEIVNYAKKGNYDLVVIGNKGLGAIPKFLVGSVSSKVANHSLCSVLIVK